MALRLSVLSLSMALLAVAAGCNVEPLAGPPAPLPPQRLRRVEPANLQAATTRPAVTVEQASQAMSAEVAAKQELPSVKLDIASARASALEANFQLEARRVEPAIAAQDIRVENAAFDPSFRTLASFERKGEGGSGDNDYLLEPGLTFPLRTGGTLGAGLGAEWDQQSDDSSGLAANFSFSQPLLRGAGVKVNTAGIRIAGLNWEIVSARTKLRVIQTLADVDRTYWSLYAAWQELRVAQQQYELALVQIEQARKRVAAGASPRIEIIRSESGLAVRLQGIIIARTQVRLRQRELKRLMNRPDLPVDSATQVLTDSPPDPVGLSLDAPRLVRQALDQRMELVVLELELAIDREVIAQRRNALLPGLDLQTVYSRHGGAGGLAGAMERLDNRAEDDALVSLELDVPLGNERAQAQLRRSRLERLGRLIDQKDTEQAIRQDVYDALDRFDENWRQIVVARRGVVVAAENYRAEQQQFGLGLRTSIDVLDAAARLAEAQVSEIRAIADYEIAKVDLAVATGTLLGQDGVCWQTQDLGDDRGTGGMSR